MLKSLKSMYGWTGVAVIAAAWTLSGAASSARGSIVDLQVYDINPADSPPTGNGGTTPLQVMAGAAAIGATGDVWNTQQLAGGGFTTPALHDTAGLPTTATVSLDSGNGSYYEPLTSSPLLQSYAVSGGTMTVNISGLTPGGTYDLYLYGTNGRGTVGSTFTTNGVSKTADGQNVGPIYAQGHDYVSFLSQTANAQGVITFTDNPIAGPGNCCSILNGLQIQGTFPTPEPASIGLLAIGGFGLLARRRSND